MKSKKVENLNFPEQAGYLLNDNGNEKSLHCLIRQKTLHYSPEEWVRQNMLHFLINYLKYPKGLISVEKSLKINGLSKRWDLLVYSNISSIFMLMELKAPEIKLNKAHAEQLLRYQSGIDAKYLVLSNGLQHLLFMKNDAGEYNQLKVFPEFRGN